MLSGMCHMIGDCNNLIYCVGLGSYSIQSVHLNPLHPNISMHILHTVLCTFPKVLTGRICLTVKSVFNWSSFPLFLGAYCLIQG